MAMINKRRIDIPVWPYILLLVGLAIILGGALIYFNYPSNPNAAWGTIAAGALMLAGAFAGRPAIAREIFTSRKTILWINDVVLILIVISIGAILTHIGFRRNFRYDFTYNKMFSLSELTVKTLRTLDKDVKVVAFFPGSTAESNMIKELLEEYRRHSARFSFSIVDPMRDPVITRSMNVGAIGTVVVQSEISRHDLYNKDLFKMPDHKAPPGAKPQFLGEQALTSAIYNVTSGERRRIMFVKGHGEPSINGYQAVDLAGANELLTKENFDVEEISLVEQEIETGISALVIVAPKLDFLESELEKIKTYLNTNGNLMVALDPSKNIEKLEAFLLKEFGVKANNDIVVDPRGIQRNYWTVAPDFPDHEIVSPIKDKDMLALMFHCQSLDIQAKDEYKVTPFLKTIANSWAKRKLQENEQLHIGFEEGRDERGPFNIGLAIEQSEKASGTRAVIFGDSDFFANGLIGSLANRDVFINSVNWMVGQPHLIAIRPRVLEIPRIILDENDAGKIFTFSVFVSPALIMLLGLCVYLYRKRA